MARWKGGAAIVVTRTTVGTGAARLVDPDAKRGVGQPVASFLEHPDRGATEGRTAGASAGQAIREALRDPGGARRVPAKARRGPCVLLVQFTAMETFVHNAAAALERREVVTPRSEE